MTIRKQFISLASLIIAIPILCLVFASLHKYYVSSERLLIKGYKEVQELDYNHYSAKEWDEIFKVLDLLPPEVEAAIIDKDLKVLISSINNIKVNSTLTKEDFFHIMKNNCGDFYYQFTTFPVENERYFLITGVPREKKSYDKRTKLIYLTFILLIIIVTICFFLLILICINFNKSIYSIQKQTHAIANGDINKPLSIIYKSKNEITAISESLEKMRLSLLEAQNQKNKLIMGISHDLRTPVSIIKGYTEGILDGFITEKEDINQSLELIQTKTNQLEEMISTLINFTKLNSSEIKNDILPQSITSFISEYSKSTFKNENVFKRKLITDINFSKEVIIPFDKQLISRAFENLFGNALRYTNPNDSITLKAWDDDDYVYLSFIDTGCGIDKNDLDNIFELFYRGTSSRREEGMGIGLSVVKHIIDIHKWKICVDSKKHIGSTFTIKIPINPKD